MNTEIISERQTMFLTQPPLLPYYYQKPQHLSSELYCKSIEKRGLLNTHMVCKNIGYTYKEIYRRCRNTRPTYVQKKLKKLINFPNVCT